VVAQLHPLQRLAIEAPEQLVPVLRRIAFKYAQRRIGAWLRRNLAIAVTALERLRRMAWSRPCRAGRTGGGRPLKNEAVRRFRLKP
jgi:hypothetical protein